MDEEVAVKRSSGRRIWTDRGEINPLTDYVELRFIALLGETCPMKIPQLQKIVEKELWYPRLDCSGDSSRHGAEKVGRWR